jgi:hypothetical protein
VSSRSNRFDAKELALTQELKEEIFAAQAARTATETSRKLGRRAQRVEFVMLPYAQTMSVAGKVKTSAALAVMVELAYQVFKTHKPEVVLSNSILRTIGISRKAKLRALRQLETAGIVAVDWRGQKSPLVTVLWATKSVPSRAQ